MSTKSWMSDVRVQCVDRVCLSAWSDVTFLSFVVLKVYHVVNKWFNISL